MASKDVHWPTVTCRTLAWDQTPTILPAVWPQANPNTRLPARPHRPASSWVEQVHREGGRESGRGSMGERGGGRSQRFHHDCSLSSATARRRPTRPARPGLGVIAEINLDNAIEKEKLGSRKGLCMDGPGLGCRRWLGAQWGASCRSASGRAGRRRPVPIPRWALSPGVR